LIVRMRSSRLEERKNDFEPAVVIPTRLCYVYIAISGVRGEVEQKRKARGDELDLVGHLSSSSTFCVVVIIVSFLLFLPSSAPSRADFSHSPLRARGRSAATSCMYFDTNYLLGNKIGNDPASAMREISRWFFSHEHERGCSRVSFSRTRVQCDHDSKSEHSLPLH